LNDDSFGSIMIWIFGMAALGIIGVISTSGISEILMDFAYKVIFCGFSIYNFILIAWGLGGFLYLLFRK